MSRTCGSCGRSWHGAAAFCGACGDLLPDALSATVARTAGDRSGRRGPLLAVALGIAVLAGATAVPSLSIERTPPVTGEIGVPEADDLRTAPPGTTRRRAVPAPDVTCAVADRPVTCVVWSRDLVGPASPDGRQAWPAIVDRDHVLLAGQDALTGVDVHDGTRLWQDEAMGHAFPHDAGSGVVVLDGPAGGAQVRDLTTGQPRWESEGAGGVVQGDVVQGDVVLTGAAERDEPAVVARDLADGTQRWRWGSPWRSVQVAGVTGDRILLMPTHDESGLAVLDVRTGAALAVAEAEVAHWLVGVVADVAVLALPAGQQGSSRRAPAGDGGALLRGVSLLDGQVAWEHRVPAGDVMFGLVDGVVLAPSTDRLTVLDARTGVEAWRLEPTDEAAGYHGPLGATGAPSWQDLPSIVVTVDDQDDVLRGRDPLTGEVRWATPVDGVLHVAVSPEAVWAVRHEGFVLLDPDTGRERLQVHAPGHHPAGFDPLVLFHHGSGTVTRLSVPEEAPR